MAKLNERLARLERAESPAGTAIVDGVRMDLAQMIQFFRRRAITEADRQRAEGIAPERWRDRLDLNPSLTGDLYDRIRGARRRVAAELPPLSPAGSRLSATEPIDPT